MESHDEKADEFERGADQLDQRGDDLDREIGEVKQDWEGKVSDDQIPGALAEGDTAPGGVEHYEDEDEPDPDVEREGDDDERENAAAEQGGAA